MEFKTDYSENALADDVTTVSNFNPHFSVSINIRQETQTKKNNTEISFV